MTTPVKVETYFDPDDGLENKVIEEISRARISVWIQAYKFSSEKIVKTIVRLKKHNPRLDVRLALDASEGLSTRDKKQGKLIDRIAAVGGQVSYVSDADKTHSKFIVVDSEVVLTGSFNFKQHAKRVQRDNI